MTIINRIEYCRLFLDELYHHLGIPDEDTYYEISDVLDELEEMAASDQVFEIEMLEQTEQFLSSEIAAVKQFFKAIS